MKENKLIIFLCFLGLTLNIWGTDIWQIINRKFYIPEYNSRIKYIENFNDRVILEVRKIFHPHEIVSCGFKLGMDNFSDYLKLKINNEFIVELAIDSELNFEESLKKIDQLDELITSDSAYSYLGREDILYNISEGFHDNTKWLIKK